MAEFRSLESSNLPCPLILWARVRVMSFLTTRPILKCVEVHWTAWKGWDVSYLIFTNRLVGTRSPSALWYLFTLGTTLIRSTLSLFAVGEKLLNSPISYWHGTSHCVFIGCILQGIQSYSVVVDSNWLRVWEKNRRSDSFRRDIRFDLLLRRFAVVVEDVEDIFLDGAGDHIVPWVVFHHGRATYSRQSGRVLRVTPIDLS